MRLYDAHNHLQEACIQAQWAQVKDVMLKEGLAQAVVNGSSESDWPQVLALARAEPWIRPAFGLHPWYVKRLPP